MIGEGEEDGSSDEEAVGRRSTDGIPPPAELDSLESPPRRGAFAPSFFVVLALGLGLLAVEPTRQLSYELFGPTAAVDLGGPGEYRLDRARDGERAKVSGLLSPQYAQVSRHGRTEEVRLLLGTAMLVRREPRRTALGRDEVERFTGEGRLVRLGDRPSTFFARLLRPDARFDKLREKFEETGLLPPDRPSFLLLTGDLPRARAFPILLPFVLWMLVAASLWGAVRAARRRREARVARRRLARALSSDSPR